MDIWKFSFEEINRYEAFFSRRESAVEVDGKIRLYINTRLAITGKKLQKKQVKLMVSDLLGRLSTHCNLLN